MGGKIPQVVAFSFLVAVLCLGTVAAKSNDRMLAQIPFSFVVRDQEFPAGEYIVEQINTSHILLTGPNGQTVITVGYRVQVLKQQDQWQLVFNKYPGDRLFLSQLWTPGVTGLELAKCSKERAIVYTTAGPTRIAINLKPVTDKRRG